MGSMEEKVVLITGAGSGIGQAVAVEFASIGCHLVITGRTQEKLEKTRVLCQAQGLAVDKILCVVSDVTKEEDNLRVVDSAIKKYGRLDILVNNAGQVVLGTIHTSTLTDLDSMYNIHVRAVFNLCQLAIPHLLKTKGNIVNISSVDGICPEHEAISYSIMKCAMDQLTKTVSLDLASKGVRVNSVNPGIVRTDIFDEVLNRDENEIEALFAKYTEHQPMMHLCHPSEVAKVVVFLASPSASFVTGVTIPVDGGFVNTTANAKWT